MIVKKLIINGEEQDIPVTSVNGQTGDVTVTSSHGIASMMRQNSRWELLYGTLSEDTICMFTTSSGNQALEGSIYTTDGTEIISIAGTIPNSLYTSSMATGILKEIQGEWYFFPRQGAGAQNPPV